MVIQKGEWGLEATAQWVLTQSQLPDKHLGSLCDPASRTTISMITPGLKRIAPWNHGSTRQRSLAQWFRLQSHQG